MMRSTYVVLSAVTIGVQPSVADADLRERVAFDVPSQELPAALLKFASTSGVQVTTPGKLVEGKISQDAIGTFDGREALQRILKDTQLRFEVVDENTVSIVPIAQPKASGRSRASNQQGVGVAPARETFWDRIRLAQLEGADAPGTSATPAQQTTSLEEIIVTAQKRQERLLDVPVAVSAIKAETLTNSNLLRIEDYYLRLPGVSVTLVGSGSEPMIVIRGMATFVGASPTAGVVIDEVSYGRSNALGAAVTMPDIDPGDLERVEILRGPQGTLYGASSIGGLLKFVTVDPSTERLSGRVQVGSTYVEQGHDLGHSVRGSVNLPVSDSLAVRMSGFTLRDPGYIDNPETGQRGINERDSSGGRFSALWRPSDNFSVRLSAMFQDSERNGSADSDRTLEPDLARTGLPGIGGSERKTEAFSATLTGTVGSVEVISATGYSVDELNNSFEFTSAGLVGQANTRFPGTGRVPSHGWFEDRKFSQELRASIPMGNRLNWLVGLYYTEEKSLSTINVYASDATAVPVGLLVRNSNVGPTAFEERAVFTNLTIDVTDRFDVQLGGRFSENDQVYSRASVLLGTNPLDASYNFFEQSKSTDDSFTYLITPRWKISPDLMAYVRVASGYRPGGPNFNCGLVPANLCEFDADTSTNYEIGLKGTLWDRRLSFDTAVYYIDWKDLQVGPLTFTPGITYLANASRARAQGVELSVEAKPWTGMELSASVSYNDAELADPMPAQFSTGNTFVPEGTRLPFSAPWTGSLSTDQSFPLGGWNGATGQVGITLSYVDKRWSGFPPRPALFASKPAYAQVDFRTGIAYETWRVNAFVNNVGDRRGVLRGGADGTGPNFVNYIQPRTFGLTVSKDF